MQAPHRHPEFQSAMKIFLRIGRWGGCIDCPETCGDKFPEFCKNTKRADHNLSFEGVIALYDRLMALSKASKEDWT